MPFAVKFPAKGVGKVDLQHAGLGFGDGILEKDALRVGVDACPFGV